MREKGHFTPQGEKHIPHWGLLPPTINLRENRGIKAGTLVSWQHGREGRCRLLCAAGDVASFSRELRFYFGTVVASDVSYRFSTKTQSLSACISTRFYSPCTFKEDFDGK